LAGHLKKTVGELLDTMDSRELSEWMAFASLEPLDGDRGDIHAAQVCSVLANQWRGKESEAGRSCGLYSGLVRSSKAKEK